MNLYGCHFEYAGVLSRKYDLIIASVSTTQNLSIAGKIEAVSAFNKRTNSKYDLGNKYDDSPLEFDMEVVSEYPINAEYLRQIQKWLFNQRGFQKLYIDRADAALNGAFELLDGTPRRTYLNCKFINPEIIEGNGGICGYKFTAVCDSGLAWQDPISREFTFNGGSSLSSQNVSLLIDTDKADFTYPKVTIVTGSMGGNIGITNHSDDSTRSTTFADVPAGMKITINGAVNYVSGGFYENFVDRNFPRLLDGENVFEIAGDVVSVTFEWQNMRYL